MSEGSDSDNNNNTSEVAAKGVGVESADLSKQITISQPLPQKFLNPVEELRRRCKLYYLLTDDNCEKELCDMVAVARDCLTQQGRLPINTDDENDAEEEVKLQSRLSSSRYRLVFKRAYILVVLTVCPIFYNMLVLDYAVDSAHLDKFVNDPLSDFSRDCLMYITGEIENADKLVARAVVKWTQEMDL
jgi:hypothetical protein